MRRRRKEPSSIQSVYFSPRKFLQYVHTRRFRRSRRRGLFTSVMPLRLRPRTASGTSQRRNGMSRPSGYSSCSSETVTQGRQSLHGGLDVPPLADVGPALPHDVSLRLARGSLSVNSNRKGVGPHEGRLEGAFLSSLAGPVEVYGPDDTRISIAAAGPINLHHPCEDIGTGK